MEKNIKDYLHLYLGCEVRINGRAWNGTMVGMQNHSDGQDALIKFSFNLTPDEDWAEYTRAYSFDEFKPILRPLSDMTEEEFKEFAKPKSFATHNGYWYACDEEIDPEFEGEVIEHINYCCDDDPENVIVCNIRSKHISYGWIEYEERYHEFGVQEEAEWVRFLLSKSFDLFGLIPAGLAIDKATLTQKS